ncbi:MAG: sigma-54-dependent transcriptional regulator [Thermodesulfobacteriota bacterium]
MQPKNQLSAGEREFFSLVSRAMFVNPFSEERSDLDRKIAGQYPQADRSEIIARAVEEVARRIEILEQEKRSDLHFYAAEDAKILEKTFLFDFFYRFKDRFDQLIRDQIQAGENPIKIPFYPEALSLMLRRGFTEEMFRRNFELGFQARRAFFFIDRTLVGNSRSMKQLRLDLWNNVFTHNIEFYERYLWNRLEDFSTLILGETGTGKGTAALAIGRSGFIPLDKRKRIFVESFARSFVSLNLSQFPETLIESELFGHKKGAFTGALEDHNGVFDRCSPYGAILLDEIGEVSRPVQIKLLQVLQERIYSPVGSQKKNRFHGRVIAATNRPIEEIRGKGLFRDDFYYRLCSDIITVPPLRQRIQEAPEELDRLLYFTVEKMIGTPSPELVAAVRAVIDKQLGPNYAWPGNVRELEQCVRRVLLKGTYAGDFQLAATELNAKLKHHIDGGDISAQHLTSAYCSLLYQRHGTFEEVSRRTALDRRTVKKYIQEWGLVNAVDEEEP